MFKLYKKLFKYVPERKTFAYGSMLLAAISTICLMASYWYLWDLFCELLVTKDYCIVWSYLLCGIDGITYAWF